MSVLSSSIERTQEMMEGSLSFGHHEQGGGEAPMDLFSMSGDFGNNFPAEDTVSLETMRKQ